MAAPPRAVVVRHATEDHEDRTTPLGLLSEIHGLWVTREGAAAPVKALTTVDEYIH
jgi:hypothetical protein